MMDLNGKTAQRSCLFTCRLSYLAVKGGFRLTMNGRTAPDKTCDTFQVARGVTHAEKYGAQDAVFWAERKN